LSYPAMVYSRFNPQPPCLPALWITLPGGVRWSTHRIPSRGGEGG